jgi:hypothetical protein
VRAFFQLDAKQKENINVVKEEIKPLQVITPEPQSPDSSTGKNLGNDSPEAAESKMDLGPTERRQ